MIELIAFDADDTLWHTEHLYQEARRQFRELLRPYVAIDTLDDHVHDTEMRNLPYYGFGITSFILSLIETAVEVSGGRITGAEVGRLLEISRQMVSADVELIDEVEETLVALSAEIISRAMASRRPISAPVIAPPVISTAASMSDRMKLVMPKP